MKSGNDALVSVIMPLYNGQAFLEIAVKSVQAQTWPRWELLIVDDGSRDDSLALARRLAGGDSRIRVLQHASGANRGVSRTRNLGIEASSGKWIALLDCDDVWLPDKLGVQAEAVRANPEVVLLYSKAQVIDDRGAIVERSLPNMSRPPIFGTGVPDRPVRDFPGFLRGRYWAPASSVMFPRDAAAACGNFEPLPYQVEDTLLFCRLAERGAIWFTDRVLIHYRIHGKQWNSSLYPSRKVESRVCYMNALARTLEGDSQIEAADVLTKEGIRGLGQTLVSAREIRLGRLFQHALGMLRAPYIPARFKVRVVWIVFQRLLATPLQALLLSRSVLRRSGRNPDAVTPAENGRPVL